MSWWKRITGQDRYIDGWVKGLGEALGTAAGVKVTVSAALGLPGVGACIRVLSDDIAKVPLELKRRNSDGGFELVTDHPLAKLLRWPRAWRSSYLWRKSLVHAVLAHGNGYTLVERDADGFPVGFSMLQPGATCPRWASDGEPFFDVAYPDGGRTRNGLTFEDIIHVAYNASCENAVNGGVLGISPIIQNKEAIGVALATERFAGKFFANGARPSMIIEMDRKLPNDEVGKRIRASIERVYSGADQAFKVAILELGMKMREFSSNPQESQLIETRKEQAVQQCTMFGVPPHKIGILDRATFSNIEHQGVDYVTSAISSLAQAVESAIEITCLTPEEREVYKVEHNLDALMRGDLLSRYRAYAIGRQWGWLSADDVRELEAMNKLPNEQGKQYLSPTNMVPADDLTRNPQRDPAKEDEDEEDEDQPPAPRPQWVNGKPLRRSAFKIPDLRGRVKLLGPDGEPVH